MSYIKRIIFIVPALLLATLFVSCSEDPAEPGPAAPLGEPALFDLFKTQFNRGRSLKSFAKDGAGNYVVTFSDKTSCVIDPSVVRATICQVSSWPAVVPGKDGEWYVDGVSSGVEVSGPNQSLGSGSQGREGIVLVMYDGDGLYVRLSSGRMFYFHKGFVKDIGCFRFEMALNPSLSEDIVCNVANGMITGYVDSYRPPYELRATVAYRGDDLVQGANSVLSSVSVLDYSGNVSFNLQKGTVLRPYTVIITDKPKTGRIPVLTITTAGKKGIEKNNYISATMRVEDYDGLYSDVAVEDLALEIKGRGNSTWDMEKKPYKIKLAEKQRFMGMSDSKHWVLMANYSDKTLLRNNMAFELSRVAGMPWVPRYVPVEVVLNDKKQGVYMLTEHVRVASERVDIELAGPSDNSGDALTGGYFIWVDSKCRERDEDKKNPENTPGFRTPRGLPVNILGPEEPTTEQMAYITKHIKDAELAIYDTPYSEFSKILDIDSFIKYFFVEEITKDVDGDMRLSTYMCKPHKGVNGGRLYFPCVWDFDIALGNCDYNGSGNGPTGWHIRNSIWFRQLFRKDEFVKKVTEEWREFYPKLARVEVEIRKQAALIDDAQKRNFEVWRILDRHVWPNNVVLGSYDAELEYMIKFYNDRITWMNTEIEAGRHRNY